MIIQMKDKKKKHLWAEYQMQAERPLAEKKKLAPLHDGGPAQLLNLQVSYFYICSFHIALWAHEVSELVLNPFLLSFDNIS